MQQWYQCPGCGSQVAFGVRFCGNCGMQLNWPSQQQPPPQYQQQFEGPPMQGAIQYAQTRGAQIAAKYGLPPTSANRLAQILSDGIRNKRGIPGLARDIRKEFPDISKSQSELIARTETANALSTASLDRMKGMGVDGKEWVTAGDDRVCEICLGNEAAGVIPTDKAFPSGHMHPPGCENCRCALAPARLNRKD